MSRLVLVLVLLIVCGLVMSFNPIIDLLTDLARTLFGV